MRYTAGDNSKEYSLKINETDLNYITMLLRNQAIDYDLSYWDDYPRDASLRERSDECDTLANSLLGQALEQGYCLDSRFVDGGLDPISKNIVNDYFRQNNANIEINKE